MIIYGGYECNLDRQGNLLKQKANMNHGSLFSGVGGFDLPSEWMGWQNVFHCEWNDFGQKVLKYYWPNAISYGDITKTDFTIHRGNIDILTGGFPCQPFSMAGKRKGTEDDRHLWPEMLRAIREIQPKWVVGENVFGLINWDGGLVFDQVQADLEAEGYEVQPYVLPACGVNAPHKRERIWFVAHSESNRNRGILSRMEGENDSKRESEKHRENNVQYRNNGEKRNAADTGLQRPEKRQEQPVGTDQLCKEWDAADTSNEGLQGRKVNGGTRTIGPERNKQLTGLLPPTWENFPTQSPVCSRNDGFSPELDGITFPKWRNESIKAYGNAIVPQVVHQIFKAIQQYENS
jgi:DNA (cytosine-5)-methyltransferase 1